ncbi:MAG: 2-amino-4-hydroxy-6-hydroxymethyldihydropteridine diphosphokinase [Clostridiales bacterium]|nr:2-amino-4-hydroxy-6-hydroxymethyldihydropteridine diphosphokinase [Clostridiales bacterium]
MHRVFLSLGSNLGKKVDYLDNAVDMIKKNKFIHNVKVSSMYQTDPVGYLDQDVFVNIAVVLETTLAPYDLLKVCQEIEKTLNRERLIRWGPRTIDVDIILYDDLKLDDKTLTIPHPRMHERAFVLVPICELDSELVIQSQKIQTLIETVDVSGVRKI